MLAFKIVGQSELAGLFSKVYSHELTGFVATNALDQDTMAVLKRAIEINKEEFYTDLNDGNGFSIPSMFGQLHKTQPAELVDKYFADISGFCAATDRAAGIDVKALTDTILNKATVPGRAQVLPGFLPYSLRTVHPGRGGLDMHKDGDLISCIHDNISKQIQEQVVADTLASWFFTLQAPDSGGELWVADSDYSGHSKHDAYDLIDVQGTVTEEKDIKHIRVATPPGSLLVFRGGSYWHKVLPPVQSGIDRITFGGFIAQAREDGLYYYWS